MAAPTYIQEAETAFNSDTTPKGSGNFTTVTGDVVVAVSVMEDTNDSPLSATGTNVTLASQQEFTTSGDFCGAEISAGVVASGGTTSVSFAKTGATGPWFGGNALTFRSSDGIGASAQGSGSGAPTLNLVTTQDNSAIVVCVGDWNAADGSSRTWRTVNSITPSSGNGLELTYFRDASHYTAYIAYYSDAGAAGSKTVGLSAPGGQKYTILAFEVLGTGGSTGTLATTNANDTVAASGTHFTPGPRHQDIFGAGPFAAGAFAEWMRQLSQGATGTLARTNANDTSAATGTTTVLGTLARTNANDTSSAAGTTTVTGALARTNANDTAAASGSAGAVSGTSATTNANDTSAAAGTTTVTGSLARTNADDTLAASGAAGAVAGTLAYTNNDDTLAAQGNTPGPSPSNIPYGAPSQLPYVAYINGKRFVGSYWDIRRLIEEYADTQAEKAVKQDSDPKKPRIVVQPGKPLTKADPVVTKEYGLEVQADIRRLYQTAYAKAKLHYQQIQDDEEDALMVLL